jgi:hypothetical protein
LKDPNRSNVLQAQGYLYALNQWHQNLPSAIQLSQLNLADPLAQTGYTRRTLLQLHTLFLGLFFEPFRACLAELANIRLGNIAAKREDIAGMEYIEAQSVLAARQSARVASLLQLNQLLRSHCWVTV